MFSHFKEIFQNYVSVYSFLYFLYAVGFALISSRFHYRYLLRKDEDDYRVFIRYFVYFSLFLLVIPLAGIFIASPAPLEVLKSLGMKPGNYRIGFIVMAVSLPVSFISGLVVSKDPDLKKFYPFSKKACKNVKRFIIYEIAYLLLYYVTWEFTFRGVFLFSLVEMMENSKTGIVIAILIQTIISTVYHLGHPDTEIFSSFIGGIIFGVIAYTTRSFLYTIFLHAFIGIVNDAFLYSQYYKGGRYMRVH